jgi:hypothetical protein
MKVLKGIALGMTGFFLFIVLPLLGLALALNNTLLNPNFVAKEVRKLDLTSFIQDQVSEQLPADYQSYAPAIEDVLVELKPWLDEQIDMVVKNGYDYLRGNTADLNIAIQMDPVRQSLVNHISTAYVQSPPAGSPQLSPDQVRQDIEAALPAGSILEINSGTLGAEVMDSLDTARQIAGYFHTAYIILIVLAVVFILLIVLILREIRGIGLTLGIIFLVSGILGLVSALVTRNIIRLAAPVDDWPSQIQSWWPGFINGLFSPLNIYSLVLLIAGAGGLVVFFVYRRNQPVIAQPTASLVKDR